MARPRTEICYVTTVFYSSMPDVELDALIGGVAKINKGKWASSGYNYASGERDMRYSFGSEKSAHAFRRELVSADRGIIRARVDRQRRPKA